MVRVGCGQAAAFETIGVEPASGLADLAEGGVVVGEGGEVFGFCIDHLQLGVRLGLLIDVQNDQVDVSCAELLSANFQGLYREFLCPQGLLIAFSRVVNRRIGESEVEARIVVAGVGCDGLAKMLNRLFKLLILERLRTERDMIGLGG